MAVAVTSDYELYPQQGPRYDLSNDALHDLTSDFLKWNGASLGTGRYVCTNFKPDDPMANVGRTIERQVFEESFGNDDGQMRAEYGRYEPASEFFLVFDQQEQMPVGVLRIIRNSEAGLKSLNDIHDRFGVTARDMQWSHGLDNLDACWDIGTLAVLPAYRGKRSEYQASSLLYRSVFSMADHEHIRHFVTVIDALARRGIKALGVPFEDIEGTKPFEYLGSKASYAMYGNVAQFREKVVAYASDLIKKNSLRKIGKEAVREGIRKLSGGRTAKSELRRTVKYRTVGKIAMSLATGKGLDPNIQLYDDQILPMRLALE